MAEFDDVPEVQPTIGIPVARPRTWVLVRDGVVTHVKHTMDWFKHPFGDNHGGRVVDGTGVDVAPGYFVDAKGNFTPAEGRTAPIPEGLPAYHSGPGTPAASPHEVAASLAGSTEPTEEGERHVDPALEHAAALATVEPRNKDMAEHDDGSEPVHTAGVTEYVDEGTADHEHPTDFAAVDAKAHD
ncbi:hypothetical protein NFI95_15605 [Acetobacteraceae bacterium KSS8]|uniref:Uncharacterized protein n=1 Tax=Endosaccharibacter trunci TaxID=2812733 RepID=A0ABT1WBR7_9PROT|nr:hypothetical protein [Acetobacteraceae bacterium KSS8]